MGYRRHFPGVHKAVRTAVASSGGGGGATISEGVATTIVGTGFGTGDVPIVFDNFTLGTIGASPENQTADMTGTWGSGEGSPDAYYYAKSRGINTRVSRHPFDANGTRSVSVSTGTGWGAGTKMWLDFWYWLDLIDNRSRSNKIWRGIGKTSAGGVARGYRLTRTMLAQDTPTVDDNQICSTEVDDGPQAGNNHTEYSCGVGYNNGGTGNPSGNGAVGKWIHIETGIYYHPTDYEQDQLIIYEDHHLYKNVTGFASGSAGYVRSTNDFFLNEMNLGQNWQRDDNGTGLANSGATAYIGSPAISLSWARVYLGNNAVFANCTHRELQQVTSWSNTSIGIKGRIGAFPDSSGWLHVITNGNVATYAEARTVV